MNDTKYHPLKKMKICLLIDTPYDPAYPSRTEVTNIFGKCFPSFGHDITWIVTSKKNDAIRKTIYNKVKIYEIPIKGAFTLNSNVFSVMLDRIKKYQYVKKLFDEEKYEIIGVRNNVLDSIFAIYIRRKYKIPFVYHYSSPIMQINEFQNNIIVKICDITSVFIMKKADLIFTTSSKYLGNYLINKGIKRSKIFAVSNCAETHNISKEECDKVKRRLGVHHEKIILYVGTLDKVRSLEIIIYAFSKIKIHNPDSKLLIVGEGNGKTDLMTLASKINILEDIIFTGNIPYNEIPKYIEVSDICISPIPPLEFYKMSSPLKVYEYMAMGKPIVANEEIPDHKDSIMNSDAGILVPYQDDAFAKAIVDLLEDPQKASKMGINGKNWALKNANYKDLSKKLEAMFLNLVNK